jgi:hypothetical protein
VGNEATGDPANVGRHYLIPAAGGAPKEILTDMPYAVSAVWSPDGCCLLAAPFHAGEGSIPKHWSVVPVDGRPTRILSVEAALSESKLTHVALNAWPSAETGVLVAAGTSHSRTSPHNLWSIGIDPAAWTITWNARALTFGADNNDSSHGLPDGRVAFVAGRGSLTSGCCLPMQTKASQPVN